jgi:single-strand DNA-binding protein
MLMNNLVMLKGRLGADAEIRTTTTGDRVANLRMVTVDVFKTKDGDWKERAEWHRVTVWGEGSINHLEKHGSKGALIDVLGQIRTRKWNDNGADRYATEIVADFRAGGEVKITSVAKGGKEQVEIDEAETQPGEDQAA